MANIRRHNRAVLIAATLFAAAAPALENRATAQQNGSENDRGGRGGREARRGDRPGGDRERGNRPAEPRPVSPPPAANPATSSFGTVSAAERIRKTASDTIKKNDKDGNGILEGDELKELRMSRAADTDGDGKITHNELVSFYTPKSETAGAASPSAPSQSGAQASTATDDVTQRKIVNTTRKSYRFKSSKERLSSWRFASKDANGDGQVSMSEYTRSWSERTASEFKRYDKDNDGMITPAEAK
jgi:Ca2+-binding EF-hand superfamily protein